jgi:predicted ABC-type ATPase
LPNVLVIAGPNGAGKSTAAPRLIGKRLGIAEFVNADVIAAGLSAFAPETVAIEAGRVMLKRLRELASEERDFAFETTLASRSFAPWLARLRRVHGYKFHLSYLWLPQPGMAITRVQRRIQLGGHSVPPQDIQRRYGRGLANFFSPYMPIADSWEMHDNSVSPARMIAAREGSGSVQFGDEKLWEAIQKTMSAKEMEKIYDGESEPRLMGVPVSEVMEIFTAAGRDALARHKALGVPAVIWRDGRVVEIPPEEIEI